MRLDYNILWFEDDRVSYNGKKEMVKAIVEDELGFNFPEPRREINGANVETINYEDYDLLLVDLNLAGTRGTNLIDIIRNQGVFTEVIFYSSEGERAVRNALKEFEIDGAYCADRREEDFEDKVRKVIRTTVRKVQDINNIRGLIMAGTSDLDLKMGEIIELILKKHPKEISDSVVKKIFDDVNSSLSEKQDNFNKWAKTANIDKLMKDTLMFDASKKVSAVQHIIDIIESEALKSHKGNIFSNSYKEDVTMKRNILAHVKVETIGNKKILKSKSSKIEFTEEFCYEIRTKLKKYTQQLNEMHDLLDKV